MRKIKSLALVVLTAFAVTACSSSDEIEQGSASELYTKGQTALQEGDYSQSIRYLSAVNQRYPGSSFQEQALLNLIYANYKAEDYTNVLVNVDRFLQFYPRSPNQDYAVYMAGLSNSAMGDNFIQDFFGIDRATRENNSIKTAFLNFQSLVRAFPNSPYAPDALARMAYIKAGLARHELAIAKFYAERNAHVAVANRVVGMLQQYPDAEATYQALPLMQQAYEKMGLTKLANQAQQIIDANKDKQFESIEKPTEPNVELPK